MQIASVEFISGGSLMNSPITWLMLTLLCIAIEGFFSMVEMAALSFNRVRLEYYVSKGIKRAIWLEKLLEKPPRLFGTIMIGVNVALQVGSQSSREFYTSLNLNPDLAPLTQIFLVVILAELAPLFAARRYSEHVAMLGIPVVYGASRLFAPLIWIFAQLAQVILRIFGGKDELSPLLSRDELQKVIESHEEESEFNSVVSNIFTLRGKNAAQIMTPLHAIEMCSASLTVSELRKNALRAKRPLFPLYHRTHSHIVAIAFSRDLVDLPDDEKVKDHAKSPWFITGSSPLMPILAQFRRNQQSVAVVLDSDGAAIGLLSLDAILEEIFGQPHLLEGTPLVMERTFAGTTKIEAFNQEYHALLPAHENENLAALMISLLDHPPAVGDSVIVGEYELIVEETTLLGIKILTIKTLER